MTATAENPRALIGGNFPPGPVEILTEKTAKLRLDTEAIAARANAAPKEIKTEEDLDVVGLLVKDARTLVGVAEKIRVAEKEPHLRAGREVDEFMGAFKTRLERIANVFQGIADTHAREVAAAARREAQAEAARLRAEEDRKRKEAEDAKREATKDRKTSEADDIGVAADRAHEMATAPVETLVEAAVGKTVTASGVKATVKGEWTHEVTDFASIALEPLRYLLKADEIEAAIKRFVKNGGRQLAGVRIYEDVRARLR